MVSIEQRKAYKGTSNVFYTRPSLPPFRMSKRRVSLLKPFPQLCKVSTTSTTESDDRSPLPRGLQVTTKVRYYPNSTSYSCSKVCMRYIYNTHIRQPVLTQPYFTQTKLVTSQSGYGVVKGKL